MADDQVAAGSGEDTPRPELSVLTADAPGDQRQHGRLSRWLRRRYAALCGRMSAGKRGYAGPRLVSAGTSADEERHVEGINGLFVVMERARRGAERAQRIFPSVTFGIFCATSLLMALLILLCGSVLLTAFSPVLLAAVAVLPSVLIAGAAAHLAGNILLRRCSGLNGLERRSLALHLPWNRTPAEWPTYYRRWIYCGDWLVENFSGDLLPYVRAFVTGEVPQNIEEELALWNGLMQCSRNRCDMEVGHSVRELACVDALPSWTREITPGMNLPELQKVLGKVGRDWAVSLLKRAATRKRVFSAVNLNGSLNEVKFEFHYSQLDNGREGLMVILRPHYPRGMKLSEDAISDVA